MNHNDDADNSSRKIKLEHLISFSDAIFAHIYGNINSSSERSYQPHDRTTFCLKIITINSTI
ncbi:MAG: hypothetical protein WAZ77_06840 [Candidatus Nitrosopolaris sp.]